MGAVEKPLWLETRPVKAVRRVPRTLLSGPLPAAVTGSRSGISSRSSETGRSGQP